MVEITPRLSIGQVAERTGLSVHALRFYENEGLFLTPVRRGAGGRRVYSEDDVAWLTVCIILRASDMPLPELRRYAGLVREGTGNEEERLALMREHEARVTGRIGRLTESLDLIRFKAAVYEDIVDQGSAAAHDCHGPSTAAEGEERSPVRRREVPAE
ncbi:MULTISPECIES: MerR family transcriptional regulator [Streptomyces]|uniref:MerR family transcriptional regulator n=1 Tax=Streptomyces TaxID=1883 RepID=UPI0013DC2AC9|nr:MULTISPECIES: MerR family transcriptional regulator [Streptomyces]NDZ67102.1 MerR family transcriptional regulator [Streptomyces cyaneofuscatus]CAD5946463.1 HTH-type transcriptional regulator AdhR [Streptomyces sp. KY70]CAD5986243.1 HTH-type transcriptional regulator AdhR [Streptomyces sp. KY75]